MSASRISDDSDPSLRSPSESNEDVVVLSLANCINQVIAELGALKSLVYTFANNFEEKVKSSTDSLLNGVEKELLEARGEGTVEDLNTDSSTTGERGINLNGLENSPDDRNNENNNSSAVPNKNEKILDREKENAVNQFGNFVAAWRAIDAKVLTDLVSLMLASEVFVTDTQLNRWKKKQCTEVFYIPLKSGSDDPAEYLGSDLQEDLTNLQLLYGLLWSQLTVRIPTVSTMLNSIGEKLKRTRQLFFKFDDEELKTSLSQSSLTSTTPFVVLQTAMAVQKRTIERCLVIENQPGPLVKKERRTTVRVRLLLNPAHLPPGSNPQLMAYLLTEDDASSFHRTKFVPTDCKLVMRHQSFVCLANLTPSSPSPSGPLATSTFSTAASNSVQHYGVELSKLLIEKSHVDRSKAQGAPCRKYCLLFQADGFKLHLPSDVVPPIYLISQPFVITTHTNQEPESWAPIFWDRAFQDPDRVPFHTPAQVQWKRGFESLSMFFLSRSGRWLFDRADTEEYFAQMLKQRVDDVDFLAYDKLISKHPKSTALGSGSIWKWFFGILQLLNQEVSAPGSHDHHTQKVVTSSFNMLSPLGEPELRQLWRRGFIYGFISRLSAEKLLQPSTVPLGTFLVRFSGTEFGAVVVTWKQTTTVETEVKNILWTKEHLRKQSFLTRLKYLVDTAKQLPLFYLYRGPNSFLPIADAFGDFWDKLDKIDDEVGNRANVRPGYVAHYDSIIDKIDLNEIPVDMVHSKIESDPLRYTMDASKRDGAQVADIKSAGPSTPLLTVSQSHSLAAISEALAPRSSLIRDSLPRLFIPSPSPSPSLALAIAASSAGSHVNFTSRNASATAMKSLLSNLGDHPLTPLSPNPSSFSTTSSSTKNKLRAVIFNRSMSLPQPTSSRANGNNTNLDASFFPSPSGRGDASPGFVVSPPAESSRRKKPSLTPQPMTDQEHQVVESLLSLRTSASPVSTAAGSPGNATLNDATSSSLLQNSHSPASKTTTVSVTNKMAGKRKRKLAPSPAAAASIASASSPSRQQRFLYVPSASFPLPAPSLLFPSRNGTCSGPTTPVILSSTPSTPNSLAASPPFTPSPSASFASGFGAVDARSISPQDRRLAESLLSLSKGVPRTVESGVDYAVGDDCQAMDLSTHSDFSANGTK